MLVFLNVPVARKGEEAEFVQCGFCRRAFMPSVLESGPPDLVRDVDADGDQLDWHYAELTGAAASTLLVWEDGGD